METGLGGASLPRSRLTEASPPVKPCSARVRAAREGVRRALGDGSGPGVASPGRGHRGVGRRNRRRLRDVAPGRQRAIGGRRLDGPSVGWFQPTWDRTS